MTTDGQQSPVSKLKEQFDNLTDREQMLLKVMLGVFAVLALGVMVFLAQQSVVELEEETSRYRSALDLMADGGAAYIQDEATADTDDADSLSKADLFTEEVLRDNPVQLTSYVAQHASAVDVSVSSYDTDEHPLGSDTAGDDEGPIVVERQLTADIRGAEMERFVELLHRIEESREPIIIKRIDVHSVGDVGEIRALLIVSTFEYGDEEES